MALDATVGGASSNSYVTEAEASAYFANRLWAEDWDDVESVPQALVTASLRIDQELFRGTRATTTQALKWPRVNEEFDLDGFVSEGFDSVDFDETVIPQRLKDAVCELALILAKTNVLEQSELANFKAIEVGSIKLTMNQPVASGPLPDQVVRLLRGLRHSGVFIA